LAATPHPDTHEDPAGEIAAIIVAERHTHPDGDLSALISAALWHAAWHLSTAAQITAHTPDDGSLRLEPIKASSFRVGVGAARLIAGQPASRNSDLLLEWAENGSYMRIGPECHGRVAELAGTLASLARSREPLDGGQLLTEALKAAASRLGGPDALAAGAAWFPQGLARLTQPDGGGEEPA
jgi:hypothetical protein